jgi:hypothetical protein
MCPSCLGITLRKFEASRALNSGRPAFTVELVEPGVNLIGLKPEEAAQLRVWYPEG